MSKLSTEGLAMLTTESRLQPVFISDVLDLDVGFLEGEVVDKPMAR